MAMAALIAAGTRSHPRIFRSCRSDSFGAYPVGFQMLTALMSMLGGIPIYRSAMLMEASTLAFLTLAFMVLCGWSGTGRPVPWWRYS
jgi:hypothetical protein